MKTLVLTLLLLIGPSAETKTPKFTGPKLEAPSGDNFFLELKSKFPQIKTASLPQLVQLAKRPGGYAAPGWCSRNLFPHERDGALFMAYINNGKLRLKTINAYLPPIVKSKGGKDRKFFLRQLAGTPAARIKKVRRFVASSSPLADIIDPRTQNAPLKNRKWLHFRTQMIIPSGEKDVERTEIDYYLKAKRLKKAHRFYLRVVTRRLFYDPGKETPAIVSYCTFKF